VSVTAQHYDESPGSGEWHPQNQLNADGALTSTVHSKVVNKQTRAHNYERDDAMMRGKRGIALYCYIWGENSGSTPLTLRSHWFSGRLT